MISPWRRWAVVTAGFLVICGVLLWIGGGGPFLLIAGGVALITALLEPIYGRASAAPPRGAAWKPTDERFIDPETGEPVAVWFDPATGERRYVADGQAKRN